jgi:hypothetical protein
MAVKGKLGRAGCEARRNLTTTDGRGPHCGEVVGRLKGCAQVERYQSGTVCEMGPEWDRGSGVGGEH